MALTQGAWVESVTDGIYQAYCDVTSTDAEFIHATEKTPVGLDTTRPFLLIANSAGATLDATDAAIPVDVYVGIDSTFALSVTTSAVTVTAGSLIANNMIADVRTAVGNVIVDPGLLSANAAGVICRGVSGLRYGFTATAASELSAATCRFIVTQDKSTYNPTLVAGIGKDPS